MRLSQLTAQIEEYERSRPWYMPKLLRDSPQIKALKSFIHRQRNSISSNNPDPDCAYIIFIATNLGVDFSDDYLNSNSEGVNIFQDWKSEPLPLNLPRLEIDFEQLRVSLQQSTQTILNSLNSEVNVNITEMTQSHRVDVEALIYNSSSPQNFQTILNLQSQFLNSATRNRQSRAHLPLSEEEAASYRNNSICAA